MKKRVFKYIHDFPERQNNYGGKSFSEDKTLIISFIYF